jgi:peroxiredoxin
MLAAGAFAQEIPRPAPEFTIHLSDATQVQLSQYSGKVVLLAFMITT